MFSRDGSLPPSSYADARYVDDVIAFEGRSSADALRYLVVNAATAGFTILRNWGGGIFQYDAWYVGRKSPLATNNLLEVTD